MRLDIFSVIDCTFYVKLLYYQIGEKAVHEKATEVAGLSATGQLHAEMTALMK